MIQRVVKRIWKICIWSLVWGCLFNKKSSLFLEYLIIEDGGIWFLMFQLLDIIEYVNWVARLLATIDHHCWICCCANTVSRLRSYPNHIALKKGNLRKKNLAKSFLIFKAKGTLRWSRAAYLNKGNFDWCTSCNNFHAKVRIFEVNLTLTSFGIVGCLSFLFLVS